MAQRERLDDLTAREREVLDLVRLGLTNEEIAGRLGITEAGIKYHVSQILSKLGVATREEASALTVAEQRGRWWVMLPLAAKAAGVAVTVAAVAGLGLLAWGVLRTSSSPGSLFNPAGGYSVQSLDLHPVSLEEAFHLMEQGRLAMVTIEPNDQTVDPSGNSKTIETWYEYKGSDGQSERWRLEGLPVFVLVDRSEHDQLVLAAGDTAGLSADSVQELLKRVREYNLTTRELITVADYRTHISRSDETSGP